jgi:dethiobiotin synthetase
LSDFTLPQSNRGVLLETAGGVMSPLSDTATMVDLVKHLQLPAILVVRHYLGSINHSMLCLEVLRAKGIPLLGVLISGKQNEPSEAFIKNYGGVSNMAFVPEVNEESASEVSKAAQVLAPQISSWWS